VAKRDKISEKGFTKGSLFLQNVVPSPSQSATKLRTNPTLNLCTVLFRKFQEGCYLNLLFLKAAELLRFLKASSNGLKRAPYSGTGIDFYIFKKKGLPQFLIFLRLNLS